MIDDDTRQALTELRDRLFSRAEVEASTDQTPHVVPLEGLNPDGANSPEHDLRTFTRALFDTNDAA